MSRVPLERCMHRRLMLAAQITKKKMDEVNKTLAKMTEEFNSTAKEMIKKNGNNNKRTTKKALKM